ncbi:hypothetical protein FRB96_007286 [Tulasnella sp. 330]|nr:hypothetical protein FRB96_007286 [Tulasnella sp. 330]KAG8878025.1 hypothetical protein FRB98_006396 [Tulasnella sp. 332]KAG8883868.1 hypothetical protein FRB97_005706 [Tulasnella sp. 331]
MAGHSKWGIRTRLMLGLLLPTYLETLDYTVVATAQPHIASHFNRLDLQSWIGTSYVLTSTVFLPVFGSIADVLGRQASCQIALLFFIVGSALCTGAQSMPMLLVGRGISGIGAAGLVSVVRIILSDSGSLNEDSFLNAMLVVLPIIGGALVDVNFRWIFAINLPTGLISSVLIFFLLRPILKGPQPSQRGSAQHLPTGTIRRETAIQKFLRIDWVGASLFIAGGILLLLGLSLGSGVEAKGFAAPVVIASLAVGGVLMIILVFWELMFEAYEKETDRPHHRPQWMYKSPKWLEFTDPLIPTSMFRNYDVSATSFGAMTCGMVLFSCFYFLAIYFSIARGDSASKSGAQLLYLAPGMGIGVAIALRAISWFKQPRFPVILGLAVTPLGIGLISMALENNNQTQLNVFLLVTGIGIGLSFAPLSLQARYSQPVSRIAIVVSMNLFFRTAGGTIGLAQLATVLNSKVKTYIHTALYSSSSPLTADQRTSLAASFANGFNSINGIDNLDPVTKGVVQAAFRDACKWSFISLLPWCCLSFIVCLGLRNLKKERLAQGGGLQGDVTPLEGQGNQLGTPTKEGPRYAENGAHDQEATGQDGTTVGGGKPKMKVPRPMGPITALIWPIWWTVAYFVNKNRE